MQKKNPRETLSPMVRKHLVDGHNFLRRNDVINAERSATFAIALAPHHAQPIELFGRVLRRRGNSAAAVELLQAGIERYPDEFGLRRELANALAAVDNLDDAIKQFRIALALRADGEVWFELGSVHDRNAQASEALYAAQNALALLPNHMPSRILLASALTATGKIDEAAVEYRSLTRHPAQAAKAWFGLMDLKTVRLSNDEIALLEKLESIPTASDTDRILLGFVLGRAYEMSERYHEALESLKRANALVRRSVDWSSSSHTQTVEKIALAFVDNRQSANADAVDDCPVIFILGMPRSGSTLVEQILSAHPNVTGAGELQHVDAVIADESRKRRMPFCEWAASAADDDWKRLGDAYLARTRRFQGNGPFTDKMPSNWRYVGALRRMLPGARFIFTDRDLLETCWSCFKQMFTPGRIAYSSDWTELVHYALDCQQLWQQWQETFPSHCRTQSHESLQINPEQQIRELLAFCKLDFDEACLNFHAVERNVRTASAGQVRQPMRRDTTHAKRYGCALASIVDEMNGIRKARS